MIPKQVVEKAVEGGWPAAYSWMTEEAIALSPSFWQALGKALGWSKYAVCNFHGVACALLCSQAIPYEFMYQAHQFYDLILTGQPTEAFWTELLAANKPV